MIDISSLKLEFKISLSTKTHTNDVSNTPLQQNKEKLTFSILAFFTVSIFICYETKIFSQY